MGKIRIGILGAADIAKRRFLPALTKCKEFEFVGIAVATDAERFDQAAGDSVSQEKMEKAEMLAKAFSGRAIKGYTNMLTSDEIDAVYIPLPPSLHYRWAKIAIENGKHVLVEKPGTTDLQNTESLIALAEKANVALNENYAFCYHKQVAEIIKIIESGMLGELWLIRTAFGFPYRDKTDFRYCSSLGGGALLDCGGYTIKAAQVFLGNDMRILSASSQPDRENRHDVDMFGSAMYQNRKGLVMQAAFGMDNYYKCELEIWGSKGYLTAPRFYTPPADFEAVITVKQGMEEQIIRMEPDDQFLHMIEDFAVCIGSAQRAEAARNDMLEQMKFIQEFQSMAANNKKV